MGVLVLRIRFTETNTQADPLDLRPCWSINIPVLGRPRGEDLTTVLSGGAHQIILTVRPFCPFVPSHSPSFISAPDDTNAVLIVGSRLFFILISGGWDTMGTVAICDAHLRESSCFFLLKGHSPSSCNLLSHSLLFLQRTGWGSWFPAPRGPLRRPIWTDGQIASLLCCRRETAEGRTGQLMRLNEGQKREGRRCERVLMRGSEQSFLEGADRRVLRSVS